MKKTSFDPCGVALEAAWLHEEQRTAILRLVSRMNERIANGAYGRCLKCSGTVARERLRALPWAELCAACQDAADDSSIGAQNSRGRQNQVTEWSETELPPSFGAWLESYQRKLPPLS